PVSAFRTSQQSSSENFTRSWDDNDAADGADCTVGDFPCSGHRIVRSFCLTASIVASFTFRLKSSPSQLNVTVGFIVAASPTHGSALEHTESSTSTMTLPLPVPYVNPCLVAWSACVSQAGLLGLGPTWPRQLTDQYDPHHTR